MKIDRQEISLEELVAGKPIQVRFRIDVVVEDGQLAVRSDLLKDKDGEELHFTFPLEEILRILLLSSPGRAQVLQIQSVEHEEFSTSLFYLTKTSQKPYTNNQSLTIQCFEHLPHHTVFYLIILYFYISMK